MPYSKPQVFRGHIEGILCGDRIIAANKIIDMLNTIIEDADNQIRIKEEEYSKMRTEILTLFLKELNKKKIFKYEENIIENFLNSIDNK